MAIILDGKTVSEKRLELLKEEIGESGLYPRLATVIVGNDPASQMYVRMKHRACERVGIGSIGIEIPSDTTTEKILESIAKLNRDTDINGILLQLPLPGQIDTDRVINAVKTEKDVDGFHPTNLGLLMSGKPLFSPCTPKGIMNLLADYRIPVAGARVVIAGRSIDVGRPMAALMTNADATITICHSRTRDLPAELRNADILISAVGKAHFITPEMVKPGAVVIDVGINQLNGKLVGDVDFDAVKEVASAITPVPGGVGPMTIATLMENTFFRRYEDVMISCRVNNLEIGGTAQPRLMGVINVSGESFYLGSYIPITEVHATAVAMIEQGADMIDIGARSTAPNTQAISGKAEAERIDAALKELDGTGFTVSVDTMHPGVLEVCLKHDIHAANDISGFMSPAYAKKVAESGLPAFVMATNQQPGDPIGVEATLAALKEVMLRCEHAGVNEYVLDPGIGIWTPFRSVGDDWELCRNFEKFQRFDRPVLAAVSRKTFIGMLLNRDPEDRLPGTLAVTMKLLEKGASIVRTHDVAATRDIMKVYANLVDGV